MLLESNGPFVAAPETEIAIVLAKRIVAKPEKYPELHSQAIRLLAAVEKRKK
jgi:hypothetical protein